VWREWRNSQTIGEDRAYQRDRLGRAEAVRVPALDLVVAMNCGNYRKPGPEQSRVNGVVLTEVVLPSCV
jgi:hypothetical protein